MNKFLLIALGWLFVCCGHQGSVIAEALADSAIPAGRTASPIQEPATATQPPATSVPAEASRVSGYDLALGETVFTNTCLTCHGKGIHDAPVLGNAEDWAPRLKQDLDTLIGHAIHGHRRMPPKGGFFQLSDREVAAAVAYAVDNGETILAAMQNEPEAQRCDPVNNLDECSASELRDMLTIQMLWLLGGKGGE
ncbi:MAG: c-type cytochrome [Gammaproteobacteria bacterium]